MFFRTAVILLFCLLTSRSTTAQVIPFERRIDWSFAGLRTAKPLYSEIRNITSYGGKGNGAVGNDAALQAAINSLGSDSGVIYFPPGIYSFKQPVTLRSGIVLRGADASSTTLQFNLGGENQAINIRGRITADTATIVKAANKKESTVTVDNAAIFQVGSYVKIYQNDAALLTESVAPNSVGQILKITRIEGNIISFNSPLRKNYTLKDQPRLRSLVMVKGVGIECLRIKRLDVSGTSQVSNIYMSAAAECWITGVESDTTNFAHVHMANSTNIEITGCYFHASFAYGSNGQGYGILAERTSGECLVENNIFRKLRHAMVLQTGANGNVFTYNYSREAMKSDASPSNLSGDILLHGNYPYANLVEGNIAENIIIDASHKTNGPNNTFFRNRATVYGFIMSSGSGDSTNIVGNEITATGFGMGNYIVSGNGNFEYGNNKRGTIVPAGTTTLPDASYYYLKVPRFWESTLPWPPIGMANSIGTGNIPAKVRYEQAQSLTFCSPRYTYTFTGSGEWNDPTNWERQMPAPLNITSGVEVIIDHPPGGGSSVTGPLRVQKPGIITVKPGKKLIIKQE